MEAYMIVTRLDRKEEKYRAYGAKWKIPLPKFRWILAKDYPTKSGQVRTYWNCSSERELSGSRDYARVEMRDWEEFIRPGFEDTRWYFAKEVKILEFYPSKLREKSSSRNPRIRKDLSNLET